MADDTKVVLCPACLHDGVLERTLARAEAAEAKLAAIRKRCRVEHGSWIRIPAILDIAGDGEGEVR